MVVKRILILAGALTIGIFIIGFYIGIQLESGRTLEVSQRLTQIDNLWNDARLLQSYLQTSQNLTYDCNFLLDQNLLIGDKIYNEGLRIEAYENVNRFTSDLLVEKQRYALLDLQFWRNTIDLKKLCSGNYSTVIYFYSQYNKTAEQEFQDRALFDLKQQCGPNIVYITFPADIGLSTLELVKNVYNIRKIPSILINETLLLETPVTLQQIEDFVKC